MLGLVENGKTFFPENLCTFWGGQAAEKHHPRPGTWDLGPGQHLLDGSNWSGALPIPLDLPRLNPEIPSALQPQIPGCFFVFVCPSAAS